MQIHASMFHSPNQLVHLSDMQILSYFMNNSEKQVTKEIKSHFWQAIWEYKNLLPLTIAPSRQVVQYFKSAQEVGWSKLKILLGWDTQAVITDRDTQHGPLGISPQALHLGTNAYEKLRGFPGGRVNVNPIYIVSTARWDATLLFWTLDGHPESESPRLPIYPFPQGKRT